MIYVLLFVVPVSVVCVSYCWTRLFIHTDVLSILIDIRYSFSQTVSALPSLISLVIRVQNNSTTFVIGIPRMSMVYLQNNIDTRPRISRYYFDLTES